MIDVLARDDRTAFGLLATLDIERTVYRRISDPAESSGGVAVLAHTDPSADWLALARRVPTITVGHGGAVADGLFGDAVERRVVEEAVTMSLADPIWPASVRVAAERHGATALRLPRARRCIPSAAVAGEVLATVVGADGHASPAVVVAGTACWVLLDIGAAFADLLDESYRPSPAAVAHRAIPRSVMATYYRAPERLRAFVQRRTYRRLQAQLAAEPCPSEYPVDPAGWLLVELVHALLRRSGVPLLRLGRWPAPYRSAAALTHDLEPSRYTYTTGIGALRRRVAAAAHPATYGVVARSAPQFGLDDRSAVAAADVVCHGLEHRGETLLGSREDVASGLVRARTAVQSVLGRTIAGFRSPRLDRAPSLLWALDRVGFEFDSSYPDVDRENMDNYGRGVRLNVPFRPPLPTEGGTLRPSRCLELPVSAPDCIQPLFEGHGVRALRRAVRKKIAFTRDTESLYVGIVHAGVFGRRDAARRGAHLAFVRRLLDAPDVWLASLSEIARWWRAREQVSVTLHDGSVRFTNLGSTEVVGLRCVIEKDGIETEHAVPPLTPGAIVTIAVQTASGMRRTGG